MLTKLKVGKYEAFGITGVLGLTSIILTSYGWTPFDVSKVIFIIGFISLLTLILNGKFDE